MHIFIVQKGQVIPTECEEMRPEWFPLTNLPYEQMWDDTCYWLPHILAEERINPASSLNADNDTVKDFTFERH